MRCLRSLFVALPLALVASCSAAGGLVDGRLAPRPWTPNAATTDVDGGKLEPLAFEGDPAEAFEDLVALLVREDGAEVLEQQAAYAHLLYRTRILRFRDDVELRLDAGDQVIHVRSASRLGLWDLGANRRRIESIRERWNAQRETVESGASSSRTADAPRRGHSARASLERDS